MDLYADFACRVDEDLDALAFSLQNPGQQRTSHTFDVPSSTEDTTSPNASYANPQRRIDETGNVLGNPDKPSSETITSTHTPSQSSIARPKFLALCINTGGIYKTLAEIDISGTISDAAAFLMMKDEYLNTRGLLSRFKFLIKPTTIEFVQVSYLSETSITKLSL